MDQVRRSVEHRADQRPKHTGHALLLVARRTDGTHLLPGNLFPFGEMIRLHVGIGRYVTSYLDHLQQRYTRLCYTAIV